MEYWDECYISDDTIDTKVTCEVGNDPCYGLDACVTMYYMSNKGLCVEPSYKLGFNLEGRSCDILLQNITNPLGENTTNITGFAPGKCIFNNGVGSDFIYTCNESNESGSRGSKGRSDNDTIIGILVGIVGGV